jgi:16S rRNA (guanine(1405)-N(7))-methyltransferase
MEDKLALLVLDIIAKQELSNLEPDFVLEKVVSYLENNRKLMKKLEGSDYSRFRRSKEHEQVLKKIRADLRVVYGVFILDDYKKREKLLKALESNPDLKHHDTILELHKSSKERLQIYSVVYRRIFEHTGVPKKILDLACGLNPISYPYLGCNPEYVACDLSEKDLEFIMSYFKLMKIKGHTKKVDLVKDDVSALSRNVDVVLLLKALDSLEAVKWNASENLMKSLKSRFIVVSFATKSIGGKKEIRKERRRWFEKMVQRNRWEFSEFELPGEFFYIVSKS